MATKVGPAHQFVDETQEYVFSIPGCQTIILSEAQVEQIARSYTSWTGPGDTIDELARRWGRTRLEMQGILKSLGVTKSSLPITPQQAETLTTEEIANELISADLGEAERAAHRQIWAALRRDAAKWRDLERNVWGPMEEATSALVDSWEPIEAIRVPKKLRRRFALLWAPTDLHFGKRGAEDGYDRAECKRRLRASTSELLELLPCQPDEIICPIGSDWYHVDTPGGHTTRGTPQDCDGNPPQIWREGTELALHMIDQLAAIAPVRLVLMAGNHDQVWSLALLLAAKQRYRNVRGVEIEEQHGPYTYLTYGQSLLGFHHGDGRYKITDLAPLMAKERPVEWGQTKHRYWFTGNLHHEKVIEGGGATLYQLPSLSGTDRWHKHKAYYARPQLVAPLIDFERGIFAVMKIGGEK